MQYFFLAIVLGIMLRWMAKVGVTHYIKTCSSNSEMRQYWGFHASVISYGLGSVLKYGGFALIFAYLIKEHLLS